MLRGIDHLVIACRDLDAAAEAVADRLGLEVGGGGRHDQLGTENRLVWLGDAYLELISVFDAGLAAASWLGPAVVHALEGGEGLASFALASDDLDADVARLRAAGSTISEPLAGERSRPDGEVVRWRVARPTALGMDKTPFLIEHQLVGPEWGEAARAARAGQIHPVGGQARLRRVELAVPDVPATAALYRSTLHIAFGPPDADIVEADLGEQVIRLLPAGHDRPAAGVAIAISSGRPRQADLLGCRFSLELVEP